MNKKVSEWVADYLAEREIRHIFGIVGAGNVRLFDAIAKKGYTEIVCVHHEQAACMAMQTYFRTSGKITASLLTTGGGSTNALTGVVGAWADSIPGVVISGNESSKNARLDNPLRMWGVQGYDSSGVVSKVCKNVSRLYDPKNIRRELDIAFRIAGSGRPGPCWLDIPMDLQSTLVESDTFTKDTEDSVSAKHGSVSADLGPVVANVIEMLRQSKRPVMWLGHGIRLAQGQSLVRPLVEKLGAPSLVSWAGIDLIDSEHPLVFGRAGAYGQRCANFVLQNADLVLAIGTRLALPQIGYDWTELARDAKMAVVDIDAVELGKLGQRGNLPICADAKEFMQVLLETLEKEKLDFGSWVKVCDGFRKKYPWVDVVRDHPDTHGFINSYPFMEKLNGYFKSDQIVVTDMGTALLSGHQVLKMKPGQRLMTSTGLGEMGFGLPGAVGASFAKNKGEVLCLNCDGGMMMNLQELQTIVHHGLPIKIIVFNNDGYLMIKHTQKSLFGKSPYVGTDKRSGVSCPDFGKIAFAFGIPAYTIRSWEDVDKVIPLMQDHAGPVICEVFMDPEQPFVPKQSVTMLADGSLVSPPLEDLSPLLPRSELEENMIIGLHPKSKLISN